MRTLSIIIPCYNEKDTISVLLGRVLALSIPEWKIEVIVVDDGSTDGTRDILRDFENRVCVLYQSINGGKGTAIMTGLSVAKGDFILIQDADLEYSPEEIPTLVQMIKDDRSVIYGSRNIKHSYKSGFWIPRLGVWSITKMVNILYGAHLTDIWTCYKLFPASTKYMFVSGRFESEIVFTLNLFRHGYKIDEVPISHTPRDIVHGKKIRYRDGVLAIGLILKDYTRVSGRNKIHR